MSAVSASVSSVNFFDPIPSDVETFFTKFLSETPFLKAHKEFCLKLFGNVVEALIYSNLIYFEKFIAPLEDDIKTAATSSSPIAGQGLACHPQSFDEKGKSCFFFARSIFANVCASHMKTISVANFRNLACKWTVRKFENALMTAVFRYCRTVNRTGGLEAPPAVPDAMEDLCNFFGTLIFDRAVEIVLAHCYQSQYYEKKAPEYPSEGEFRSITYSYGCKFSTLFKDCARYFPLKAETSIAGTALDANQLTSDRIWGSLSVVRNQNLLFAECFAILGVYVQEPDYSVASPPLFCLLLEAPKGSVASTTSSSSA